MNQEPNTGAACSGLSAAKSHRIDVSGSSTGRQDESEQAADELIELRQAQPPSPTAANVTANAGAGCSGFSVCKSHRSSDSLTGDLPDRDALRTSAGGAFAGIVCALAGEAAGFQGAQHAGGMAAPPPATGPGAGSSIAPLVSQEERPAGCAEPQQRALNAPFPGLRPDPAPRAPAWTVVLWFHGSDLSESVGFENYLDACAFFEDQELDAEVGGAKVIDQLGREIHDSDERRYQLASSWDVTRFPGVFRWDESSEILRRVA